MPEAITPPRKKEVRRQPSDAWFWTWTLSALGLVLVPAWFKLRQLGEGAVMMSALGQLIEPSRPAASPPTIARLLWFDAKLLPDAIAANGLMALALGTLVGLVQAAGVRARARIGSWTGRAAISWATGAIVGMLVGRSIVFVGHPEVLLDTRGTEFVARLISPCSWGAAVGVLVATIIQLRQLAAGRPAQALRFVAPPVVATLLLHFGVTAVVIGMRGTSLEEAWRERSVEALRVRFGWQTNWPSTALKYERACSDGMPAACAALAGMIDNATTDGVEIFASNGERQQRVIDLNLRACAGGSGAGCAALAGLYRTGRDGPPTDAWADLFERHACMLGSANACRRSR